MTKKKKEDEDEDAEDVVFFEGKETRMSARRSQEARGMYGLCEFASNFALLDPPALLALFLNCFSLHDTKVRKCRCWIPRRLLFIREREGEGEEREEDIRWGMPLHMGWFGGESVMMMMILSIQSS